MGSYIRFQGRDGGFLQSLEGNEITIVLKEEWVGSYSRFQGNAYQYSCFQERFCGFPKKSTWVPTVVFKRMKFITAISKEELVGL